MLVVEINKSGRLRASNTELSEAGKGQGSGVSTVSGFLEGRSSLSDSVSP